MDFKKNFEDKFLISLFEKIKQSKSKGIDKIATIDFEKDLELHIKVICRKINNNSYKFSPYLEVLKLKGRNKTPRIISLPTVRDKIVLLALKELLHEIFSESVNRKLPNNYIRDISNYLKENKKENYYYKLDIEKFYDTINRNILLSKLKERHIPENILSIINNAISNITVPQNTKKDNYNLYYSDKGIPQGLSISNILAQIYLLDFDHKINARNYFYRRYVDDILLISHNKFSNYRILNFIKEIKLLDLTINDDKTEHDSLNKKSFTFLSYQIAHNNISISEKNIEIFIRRIAAKFSWFKDGLKNNSKRPEWLRNNNERFKEVFLEELNEAITGIITKNRNYGWLFYFSEIDDLQLLFRLDKIIANFFSNYTIFENKAPVTLKKLTRAYFSIKYDKEKKYIYNYDLYDTYRKKRDFLVFRGIISSTTDYSEDYINITFEKHLQKQKDKAQKNIGYKYF